MFITPNLIAHNFPADNDNTKYKLFSNIERFLQKNIFKNKIGAGK